MEWRMCGRTLHRFGRQVRATTDECVTTRSQKAKSHVGRLRLVCHIPFREVSCPEITNQLSWVVHTVNRMMYFPSRMLWSWEQT
jgi:hypothetical protein